MALGPRGESGAAVAQPARDAIRLERAACACYALITLGLMWWAGSVVTGASGGSLGAPLDDSYIHFQFARSLARFEPLAYTPGLPPVPGATSLLWPALLAPALWLGASGTGLVGVCYCLGFAALFGQAREVLLAARRFLSWPAAFAAGLLVLAFSANTWFAASGMEVVPLGLLLLRSARRAAEYIEGSRGLAHERELWGLAVASVLMRPEGVLSVLMVALAFAWGKRKQRWHAAAALGLALLPALVNWLCTGSAAHTTTLAKWLPTNPYYQGFLARAIVGNLQIFAGTLLDGRDWSWTFIPEGYRTLALGCLPALVATAELRRARAHGLLLCLVGLGMLIPTTYETFLVNRLRYLWPFAGPWLLGLAAMGELLSSPLRHLAPRLMALGTLLPAAAALGFVRLFPVSLADLGQSAAAIGAQQVSLGRWAQQNLPADAKLGVNDAGAIAFYSGRQTFDVVGLTTRGEARYWVAGAGSRFEHYERLPRAELPSHFIVYPEWFALPDLLGECLTERTVYGATILGGPRMVACRADYARLGSGAKPTSDVATRRLLDELDIADLESEAAHGYVLGVTSSVSNLVSGDAWLSDGGRAQRLRDEASLRIEPAGVLIVRLSSDAPTELELELAGQAPLRARVEAGSLREVSFTLPAGVAAGPARFALRSQTPISTFHYWSYGVL
jgi:hypothetical protein